MRVIISLLFLSCLLPAAQAQQANTLGTDFSLETILVPVPVRPAEPIHHEREHWRKERVREEHREIKREHREIKREHREIKREHRELRHD